MIEVGEYVRSLINGNIYKVIEVSDLLKEPGIKYYKFDKFRGMCSTEEYNVKHSKNIIDLIEVGDYVNGYRILAMEDSIYENSKRILIYKNQKERYERWIYIQEHDGRIHTQDDIAEILTKEQYEANCYKVKEE